VTGVQTCALPIFRIFSSTSNDPFIAFTIDGTPPDHTSVNHLLLSSGPPYPTADQAGMTYLITNGSKFYCPTPLSGSITLTAYAYIGSAKSATATPSSYTYKLSPPTWAGVQPQVAYFATAQTVTLGCVSGGGGTATITYSTSTTFSVPSPADVSGAMYTDIYPPGISAALGDAGTSRSLTITAIAHQTNWQDSAALIDIFNICGPGVWGDVGNDHSKWDQATWQP
jgi:hypothetical protein